MGILPALHFLLCLHKLHTVQLAKRVTLNLLFICSVLCALLVVCGVSILPALHFLSRLRKSHTP